MDGPTRKDLGKYHCNPPRDDDEAGEVGREDEVLSREDSAIKEKDGELDG